MGPFIQRVDGYVTHQVWGWGFAVGGLVSGAAAMAFFVWRRDLLAMMVFHTVTDATGLIIAPLYADWWKTRAFF